MEGIGLALDVPGNRMFMADLGGSLYTASLDGKTNKVLLAVQGNLTGVAYTDRTHRGHPVSHNGSG